MRSASPLRYPGGKWRFTGFFSRLVKLNFNEPPIYVEPYAGGGSLALSLLFSGKVTAIYLNDLDVAIYAFWSSVLEHTQQFLDLIEKIPITPSEWSKQKQIVADGLAAGILKLGFATFFLNRTNHSGILNGGMIGGKFQAGHWKLDARFNRSELVKRIIRLAEYKDRIFLSNSDATSFIRRHNSGRRKFVYLDPPYYRAGNRLYLNAYHWGDHARLRDRVARFRCHWVVSYDSVPEMRALYTGFRSRSITTIHTARTARPAAELMFFSPKLDIPSLGECKQALYDNQ